MTAAEERILQATLQTIRANLMKKMKVGSIPDQLWRELLDEGFIESALVDERELPIVARVARERLKLMDYRFPHGAIAVQISPPGTGLFAEGSYEDLRMWALSEYVAQKVTMMPQVRRFRDVVLNGIVLTNNEMAKLLQSEAARRLFVDQFKRYGIPIIGHGATVADPEESDEEGKENVWGQQQAHQVVLRIDPPGLRFPLHTEQAILDVTLVMHAAHETVDGMVPGSVVDDLRLLVQQVMRHVPWPEADVAPFILCGVVPPIDPLVVTVQHRNETHFSRSRITLELDPWLPPQTVMQQYRAAQRLILGGDSRALGLKNVRVMRYVISNTNDRGERLPWAVLMEGWNARYPDEAYTDARLFERDYGRAFQAIVMPAWRWTYAFEEPPAAGGDSI